MDAGTFEKALKDNEAQVRKTMVWLGEDFMKKNADAIDKLAELKDDSDADVRLQLLLTMRFARNGLLTPLWLRFVQLGEPRAVAATALRDVPQKDPAQ